MRILPAEQGISEAIDTIKRGGVVAHATETCYGLACDLTNPRAVEKVFLIKSRPGSQPISALFSSVEAAKQWVEWNDSAEELSEKYLPGPLTIILPIKNELLPHLPERTLGVRVSSFGLAKTLAEKSQCPISTTSANLHGKPSAYSAQEIVEQFLDQEHMPDLILDSGSIPPAESSTVVSVMNGTMRIVRQGSIILPAPQS